jgi:hypothetical protein
MVAASFWVYVGRMVEESMSREGCRPPSAFNRPWGCGQQRGRKSVGEKIERGGWGPGHREWQEEGNHSSSRT